MQVSSSRAGRRTGRWFGRWLSLCAAVVALMAGSPAGAVGVKTVSPQGEVAKVRQARITFTDPMVRFGDPRLSAPATMVCRYEQPVTGAGRWVDDKTWVYDFTRDVPAGTRCEIVLTPGLQSLGGEPVTGGRRFAFDTGGPMVVRAYPAADEGNLIDEDQVFALLLNGAATSASIVKHAHCEVGGVSERVPVAEVLGAARADILKAVGLQAQQQRVVTLRCARPLPPEARVQLVWGRGIATPSGVASSADRRLAYEVRPPFTASFNCERVNARADCLPIRPMRLAFSSPVPRKWAERVVLQGPDGTHRPELEDAAEQGEERLWEVISGGVRRWFYAVTRRQGGAMDPADSGVSAITFKPPFSDNAELRVVWPDGLRDDAGRSLSNAAALPQKVRTSEAPPLVKFPRATFGILELNAEPTLPVTVRHVEGNLAIKGLQAGAPGRGPAVRDLTLSDDEAIMAWLDKVKRYDERRLPRSEVARELKGPLPPPRKGDADDVQWVQSRAVSLLQGERAARQLTLPSQSKTEPHPFEVIGIPMPQPGFHVVEIASPRLGKALLDRDAPMYVRTSVLVTNLGVHFKRGEVNAGVWVTTLDQARPVPDAQVQISDCRGQRVWQGRTDAQGYAAVNEALPELGWAHCQGPGGRGAEEQGYFVSARKTDAQGRADMAFVWSGWSEGIEPWRFHVRGSPRGEAQAQRFHTVMDRTLLRAGQTVSMQHQARAERLTGLRLLRDDELPTEASIVHMGSGQRFAFPLAWRGQRHADTVFNIPPDAKLGLYTVQLATQRGPVETGSFRVEEFRLPAMSGRIIGPKGALVQPRDVPLGLQVNHGNGGGAAGLPLRVSAQLHEADVDAALRTQRFPGFSFRPPRPSGEAAGWQDVLDAPVDEGVDEGAGEGDPGSTPRERDPGARLVADKLAVTLDAQGAGRVTLAQLPAVNTPRQLLVQATYADPNGEVQTLSQTLAVWPSAVVLGLRTDQWVSVKQKVATQVLALGTDGQPQAGVAVTVRAVAHRTTSTRKRLVGGFYAYDNQSAEVDQGVVCSGTSDARGLVLCDVALGTPGEVELIAQAKDRAGNLARSAASVWVTRQGEVWFGGDNQDRMDVIPERRSYEAGEVARLQVRSPFRHATALVAVERNGILSHFTVELDGRDPTIEVPVKAEWAPNVYVSVLAVRGRIREVPWYSFFTWGWRAPSEWWQAFRDDGQQHREPTAMVDLSKPAFKYGLTEIEVGKAAHTLKVEVQPDKASYPIRATSLVRVKVSLPNGRPVPAGTEVMVAAVDEALLSLKPNESWDLLGAMVQPRGYGIETATAQMQIIGKRHYGKKAAPPGGGGGDFPTRELFDTLLLWDGRVALDARGEALVKVPLNDALTSFRIVVVADAVQGEHAAWFGTGQAVIRATQDLQIISGVPPLVREGDRYRAMFTLRNTTGQPMDVVLQGQAGAALPEQRLRIAPQAAAEAAWDVTVPEHVRELVWQVGAQAAGAQDRLKFTQKVVEAVPVTVQQATLVQLDKAWSLAVAPPVKALADAQGALRGGLSLSLRPSLGEGLAGVQDYFRRYPWSCLEQKTSIAVGLRDTAMWQGIASQIPLYLDEDGLANYFPPGATAHHTGSDTLTAYLLSVTDEVSQLGHELRIPPETQARMARGLIAFVEGRIRRDFWAPASLRNGDLDVRKLAALEALSRLGLVQPRMLDSVQILPNQWPTSAVIDWWQVLSRVKALPERDKRMAEAEQVLRARLNVQGTRMGFSTERDDHWWWLMANGDVNSVRLVLSTLDKAAWQDDVPRMVSAALQRQQSGHWSTTVANAWGSVSMEAFAKRFEREAVSGSTRAGWAPGGPVQTLPWARQPTGGTLDLSWPIGFGVGGNLAEAPLRVTHEGGGRPWLSLVSKAAVPLRSAVSSGYRIAKTVTPLEQRVPGQHSRGDVWRVRLDIDVQADATWVVLNDPVPAGTSLLGNGLGHDAQAETASERDDDRGWLAYQERSFEAFRAYYRYLPKGSFSVSYTLRLNNPGTFGLPPTRMEAMYAPEMSGQLPNAPVVVQP